MSYTKELTELENDIPSYCLMSETYQLCPNCGGSGATRITNDRLEKVIGCDVCWTKGVIHE